MAQNLKDRAAAFAALGEPVRLALVDRLVAGDASPGELAADVGLGTNLLAHHLRVLEDASIIRRSRSEGDRRRSYVQLRLDQPTVWAAAVSGRMPDHLPTGPRVLFVCTANSARSQLAAAIWNQLSPIPATSAGTHPGPRIHPRAIAIAERHGLRIDRNRPNPLGEILHDDDLIVAVCDNAHEELAHSLPRLHWSIPDPVPINTNAAFERAYTDINRRVHHLADLYAPAGTALWLHPPGAASASTLHSRFAPPLPGSPRSSPAHSESKPSNDSFTPLTTSSLCMRRSPSSSR